MSKLFNLARMTVTGTPGTGTITLNAATANHISFASAGVADGDVVSYGIEDGTASEAGFGTYTASGTTLTRNLDKSTSGSLLSLTSAAEVFITHSARDLVPSTQLGYMMGLINGTLTASAAASALTIAVKTLAGADPSLTDPVYVVFRNATAATGNYTILTLSAATSFVISSGSTMGVTSSTAFRLWVVGFNDAGTFRLGAVNCSTTSTTAVTIFPLNEAGITSSTAEGGAGAADGAGVIYTGTAATSKPFRLLGFLEWNSTGLTAGTWTTTNLSTIQLYGPGIKKPGEPVQVVMTSTTTETSSTSSSFTSTTVTASISQTSAANPIRIDVAGSMRSDTAAATTMLFTLARATTAIGPQYSLVSSVAQVLQMPLAISWIDSTNTISSTTYNTRIRNTDNVSTVRFPRNDVQGTPAAYGTMILTELMG